MLDLKGLILPHSKVSLAEPCVLQTCNALRLRMFDLFHICQSGEYFSLILLNFVGHTIELVVLHVPKRLGIYFLNSSCRFVTCPHGIWGSHCTPSTSEGNWPYLLTSLRHLLKNSYTRPQSPSWYYLSKTSWEMKDISDPPSELFQPHMGKFT